jgi:hypothetical protein
MGIIDYLRQIKHDIIQARRERPRFSEAYLGNALASNGNVRNFYEIFEKRKPKTMDDIRSFGLSQDVNNSLLAIKLYEDRVDENVRRRVDEEMGDRSFERMKEELEFVKRLR